MGTAKFFPQGKALKIGRTMSQIYHVLSLTAQSKLYLLHNTIAHILMFCWPCISV